MSNTNCQAARDNMSMHTYAQTLKPTVKWPQHIDGVIDRANMHTRIVLPGFAARSSTLRPNTIDNKWGNSGYVERFGKTPAYVPCDNYRKGATPNSYASTTCSRLQIPTVNPMSECSAQRRLKATNEIGLKEKTWKNTARQWEGP